MTRLRISLVLSLLVLSTLAIGSAAAITPAPAAVDQGSTVLAANETANNTTAPADETEEERPSTANAARIYPVKFEESWISVQTADQGQAYNTSGPFAIFSVSEPIDQARIEQPGARATVLEGGRQVRVDYRDDAAPVGKESLYRLTVWFEDGSSRTVRLYASKTSVSVGAAEMKKYRPLILDMLADAEESGYERTPQGAEKHYEDVKSTAQLLDSLFSQDAKRLIGNAFGIVTNPLGIVAILVGAALLAAWQLRRHGSALDVLSNDAGKSARMREEAWISYKQDQQTAAEEPLREVIEEMHEIYWRDAYGVRTVAGLAEIFRQGVPVERDSEIKHIGGTEDLDVETIQSSWLEAVCREHRIPSVEIALSDGKAALQRMCNVYGMEHVYGEDLRRVQELLEELDESRDITHHTASSGSSRIGDAGAAGGDD